MGLTRRQRLNRHLKSIESTSAALLAVVLATAATSR
jgi:hypothetical protein